MTILQETVCLLFLGFPTLYLVSMMKFLQLLQMLPLVSLQIRRKSRFMEIILLFCKFFSGCHWSFSNSFSMLLQGTQPRILGGIIRGIKGGKKIHTEDFSMPPKLDFTHLEGLFLKSPLLDTFPATDDQEELELNLGSDMSTFLYTLFIFVFFKAFPLISFLTSCFVQMTLKSMNLNRWRLLHPMMLKI